MAIQIVFETHSTTEDNERGIATGWHHGRLSDTGRSLARALGERRRNDRIRVVFSSDLARAVETAQIAFGDTSIPILHDWRLRECDYGELNGATRDQLDSTRIDHLDRPYPQGESWRQATQRVKRFLDDLALRWNSSRVLVIGHLATRWGFEHFLNGVPLERLAREEFAWQEGWEYSLARGRHESW
jgi:alpha-ribazole phosphatase/probable phosphoglycerate mutase